MQIGFLEKKIYFLPYGKFRYAIVLCSSGEFMLIWRAVRTVGLVLTASGKSIYDNLTKQRHEKCTVLQVYTRIGFFLLCSSFSETRLLFRSLHTEQRTEAV